jgi:hypothetical protein
MVRWIVPFEESEPTGPSGTGGAVSLLGLDGDPASSRPSSISGGRLPVICLLAGIFLVSAIRIRLLTFPLERDEGEYAYFGQLILQGIPPYVISYNLKLPGTYYSYALIMVVFGQSTRGIHLGLLAVSIGSMLLIYLISRRMFDPWAGAVAAIVTGLVSASPTLLGQAAHANHFVTLYMLAGFYLLLQALERHSVLYSLLGGISMGLAFLSKQPAFFFCLFGPLVLILLRGKSEAIPGVASTKRAAPPHIISSLLAYSAGLAIPVGLTFAVMRFAGVFDRFWFWTVVYPEVYGARIPIAGAWSVFKARFPDVVSVFTPFWIMAGLGVPALFLYPGKRRNRLVAAVFLFFSFLTCVPGFHFRQHYFLPLVPSLGLMVGIFIRTVQEQSGRVFRPARLFTAGAFIATAAAGLAAQRTFFFEKNPTELCRTVYGSNPFPESLPVSGYIRQNSRQNDAVFVYGSEPQIYFYSNRKSATGYIYMYDLAYRHRYLTQMQSDMIRQVERNKPRIIIYVSTPGSWLVEDRQVIKPLSDWIGGYIRQNRYEPAFWADIGASEQTVYVSGEPARTYAPKSDNYVTVFRRSD